MKTRILCLITALILSSPLAQSTFAAGQGYGHGHGHGEKMIARMTEKLGLSSEQASSLKTVYEEKMAGKSAKYLAREEVEALIEADNPEAAAELAAEQARQRVLDRAEFRSRIKAILSEEQFAQWQAMKHRRMHRGKQITH